MLTSSGGGGWAAPCRPPRLVLFCRPGGYVYTRSLVSYWVAYATMTLRPSERRNKLLAALVESVPSLTTDQLTDTTSLVRSGLVDSLGLLNIASFVEGEIGHQLDAVTLDPAREWDTIADILEFIRMFDGSE